MPSWFQWVVGLLTVALVPVIAWLYPEDWITYSIGLGLLATFFFLYLLARRTVVDFKQGMKEGGRK